MFLLKLHKGYAYRAKFLAVKSPNFEQTTQNLASCRNLHPVVFYADWPRLAQIATGRKSFKIG